MTCTVSSFNVENLEGYKTTPDTVRVSEGEEPYGNTLKGWHDEAYRLLLSDRDSVAALSVG